MVKLEKIDGSKVELEIEVEAEKLADALNQAYKKVVKNISLPGFRKGKVPRPVLESRFGPEILYEDALEILVPEAYDKAVKETGIEPLESPQIDLIQMEKGKPVIFKAVVDVKPEVKLGEYRGIPVTQEIREVAEVDVENRLSQLQEQHATLHVVEEGAVEEGDLAVIDFTGYIDGEPFDGGTAEGYSLEIGSGMFIDNFEEQLVGMKPGEEKDVKVTFPENYHEERLAGKQAVFKVKLNEIKRKELPELNDDFAKEISEFDTLAELKDDILNKLKEQEEQHAKTLVENKIIEQVAAAAEVELPDVLVEREIDRQLNEMEQYLRMQGLTLEKFLETAQKSLDDLREQHRPEAEKRVKANLVLDAIIAKEGIAATDEEIEERIKKFAESYNQDVQVIKDYFAAQGQLDVIRQEIQFRKAIDFLVAEAQITTEIVSVQNQD